MSFVLFLSWVIFLFLLFLLIRQAQIPFGHQTIAAKDFAMVLGSICYQDGAQEI